MNICLIHKEKNQSTELLNFLGTTKDYVVEEFFLSEINPFVYPKKKIPNVIIFDVIATSNIETDVLILENIVKQIPDVPILLITGSTEVAKYREKMLDHGVDSCIQLPFLKEELFLRLKKLTQKSAAPLFSGTKIGAHQIEMDIRNHTVKAEGQMVELTKTEYGILFHLFLHKDTIVRYDHLSNYLGPLKQSSSHALNVHIFNLRKKIKGVELIKTIPAYGFMVQTA